MQSRNAILLAMQVDPTEEWRRLTALYGEMGDFEIAELAEQIDDLTDGAKQVLREEIKKRGIDASGRTNGATGRLAEMQLEPYSLGNEGDGADAGETGHEYTWKTPLCACGSLAEAQARVEMLRRAGIDGWIDRPGSLRYVPYTDLGEGALQIQVAADQLEMARVVIAQPVPKEIIDELRERDEAAAYELPLCPKCKAEDPTLESVEPANQWLCESCGPTWSDPVSEPGGTSQTAN
jgi:hypothetical protein